MKICQVVKKSAVVETASCKEVDYFAQTALYQKIVFLKFPKLLVLENQRTTLLMSVLMSVVCLPKNTHALGKEKSLI